MSGNHAPSGIVTSLIAFVVKLSLEPIITCLLGQVRNAASRFSARAGAGIVEVLLDLDTLLKGSEAVVGRFRSTLAQYGSRIKLAVIDHITSSPTIHMPVTAIAALCQTYGIKGVF